MRTVILYHPNSEFAGMAEDYRRDFETKYPDKKIELTDVDKAAGTEMAALYDVVRYPAILIIAEDGGLQKFWQDQPWPLMDEVESFLVN